MEPQPLKNAEQEIAVRVLTDEEFRRALLDDAGSTLEREYGVKIPEGVTIQVHEEDDSVVHLVVPSRNLEKLSRFDLDNPEELMREWGRDKTGCCTCGSSTEQTLSSLQAGCGC